MNLENLQQILLEWQRTLKLLDWDVSVKVVPHREMLSGDRACSLGFRRKNCGYQINNG
ncbi:MAG: hypothetical protein V7K67_27710 [Nostoc sp.]|uniref:hypothetical protein n=1 Tax=Nostoc sp. TaxID=1180 RepID=UPI002FFB4E32